jgi:hypothetical protein
MKKSLLLLSIWLCALCAAAKDDAQAEKWYAQAEELYMDEKYAEAFKLFGKAAKEGHDGAQEYLGEMYLRGEGVKQDYAKAMSWFTVAAEQGNAEAQVYLAYMFAEGDGVEKNSRLAFEWWRKAAAGGNAEAQRVVAAAYYAGSDSAGVKKDPTQGLFWYGKAAQHGDEDAARQVRMGDVYMSDIGSGYYKPEFYNPRINFKPRKPMVAFALGLIPIPGFGQFYNGQITKGSWRAIIGSGGLLWLIIGSSLGSEGMEVNYGGFMAAGAAMWAIPWVWGWIDAPIVASKKNRRYGVYGWNVSKDSYLSLHPQVRPAHSFGGAATGVVGGMSLQLNF